MKLYSKQLNSLEELKREKHVLKYAVKHTDEWLSLKDMTKRTDEVDDAAGAGMIGTLISALGSKSMFSTVLAMAPPLITMLSKRSHADGKKKSNPIEKLAKEVILGYVKWKAVQMVYRGIRMAVTSKKEEHHKNKERK